MSTITIDLDNLTAEEQETVRRLAKKKKPYWVPNFGDECFSIANGGYIRHGIYQGDSEDVYNIALGNCFRTKEEAEEARIRLQMQTKWKRLSLEAGEADNPWDGEHGHWEVTYYVGDGIGYDEMTTCRDGVIHFPTKESLKAAIKELGEENVKKYILGVEK